MVMRARPARSSTGCLFTLLIVVAAGYFGLNIGRVYLRHYRFQDAMAQEARFAHNNTDADIVRRLRAQADSLGLPDEAHRVIVRRTPAKIHIRADYVELVELPGFVRPIEFSAQAERAF
jgi:hypothetical protein